MVKIIVEVGDEARVVGFSTFHAEGFDGNPLAPVDFGRNLKVAYDEAVTRFTETLDLYAWEGVAGLTDPRAFPDA